MFEHDNPQFPVVTPRHTLARFMAHYELFKLIKDAPGCIVDIGVGTGGSTWAFAAMLSTFNHKDSEKVVYGFDTFEGFPAVSPEDGSDELVRVGGMRLMVPEIGAHAYANLMLYKGDICETVPKFVASKPHLRVALLNLDVDLYAPTKAALECFEPLVVPGGVIILDEYYLREFPGEKKAVDDYYHLKYEHTPYVRCFPWHNNPSGYILKGEE